VGSVVQIYSGPPSLTGVSGAQEGRHGQFSGELAQLGERLVCNQEVTGSSPVFSTSLRRPWLTLRLRLARQPNGLVYEFGARESERPARTERRDDSATRVSA
jgi:hypothetical protein